MMPSTYQNMVQFDACILLVVTITLGVSSTNGKKQDDELPGRQLSNKTKNIQTGRIRVQIVINESGPGNEEELLVDGVC